jgi:hypothetical protein
MLILEGSSGRTSNITFLFGSFIVLTAGNSHLRRTDAKPMNLLILLNCLAINYGLIDEEVSPCVQFRNLSQQGV